MERNLPLPHHLILITRNAKEHHHMKTHYYPRMAGALALTAAGVLVLAGCQNAPDSPEATDLA